jgi:prepilin-type N-terminal cleavage/methylation domain-containing protein
MLKKRNQKGFTLIEIIAVLVILGILAAVAIPKYFSMQEEARIKAASGAIAEAKSRGNLLWAKKTLKNMTADANAIRASIQVSNMAPDFTISSAAVGTNFVTFSVTLVQGITLTSPVTGTWARPE